MDVPVFIRGGVVDDDRDFSTEKGVADEANFNEFVPLAFGELVSPLIEREGVRNADYLFRLNKVVAEHKIMETDFSHTPQMLEKVDAAFAKYPDENFDNPRHPLHRELFGLLRVPLKRIIEKANVQIRETKRELGLVDHRGIVFLVNDNFKGAPPGLVVDLVTSIIHERERYRSVNAVVYLTNHFVEVAEVPFAALVWHPIYKTRPSDDFHKFIDWLGGEWSKFMEGKIGPFDGSSVRETIDWKRSHVVTGTRRSERYEGDD